MNTSTADLRHLTSRLRYASETSLIGLEIDIQSARTLPSDIRQALVQWGLPIMRLRSPTPAERELSLVKYAVLDLTYILDPEALENTDPGSLNTLDELGFDVTGDENHWMVLGSEVKQCKAYLRLFLRASDTNQLARISSRRLPNEFFPQVFRIEDACLTNAPSVWLFKHFYM